jgi:fermentation-respiration switch protein FrsA (DUF1100 family)
LKELLIAGVSLYLAIAGVVWLLQDRLTFYPREPVPPPAPPAGWRVERVEHVAVDGTRLVGVLTHPGGGRVPLVIYFGGNAEEVTSYAADAARVYGDRAVLLVNYRGYGESGGEPSEKRIVADGTELYDWAMRRADVDPQRIALHGRSLGTGVAVQVAAARPARCVILTSPFAAAVEVAAEFYPWLPVRLLMRNRFESIAHAPSLSAPVLILIGESDNLVAPHHSRKLAAAWGGPVEVASFAGFGHNDVHMSPRYDAAVRAFLDRNL